MLVDFYLSPYNFHPSSMFAHAPPILHPIFYQDVSWTHLSEVKWALCSSHDQCSGHPQASCLEIPRQLVPLSVCILPIPKPIARHVGAGVWCGVGLQCIEFTTSSHALVYLRERFSSGFL